jgi:hypothetical protein
MSFSHSLPPPTAGRAPLVRGSPHVPRRRVAIVLGVLALLAAALTAARPVWQEALADIVQGDASRVARALARQLAREGPRLGPVESSGAEVRLPGSRLRLEVLRQPPNSHDAPARQAEVHVHVRVAFGAAGDSCLEACIYGRGADRRAAIEQAAEAYRTRAFPVVLALATGDASDARPFGGTEPWGVTGRRGFAGPVFALGSASAEVGGGLLSAPLFEGVTVPADGRGHLLKAVLLAQNGAWTRTVELDGDSTSVAGAAWNGAAAPAGVAVVIRFASFLQVDRGYDAQARETGLRRLGFVRAAASASCPLDPLPDRLRAARSSPPSAAEAASWTARTSAWMGRARLATTRLSRCSARRAANSSRTTSSSVPAGLASPRRARTPRQASRPGLRRVVARRPSARCRPTGAPANRRGMPGAAPCSVRRSLQAAASPVTSPGAARRWSAPVLRARTIQPA